MSGYSLNRLVREMGRFAVVGAFNVLVCLILYEIFVFLDPWPAYTLGFAFWLSEGLSCIVAHYLHRRVTFQSSSPYARSLTLTLIIYGASITIASYFHHFIAEVWDSGDLNPVLVEYGSWYINTALVGVIAFLALRFIAFPPSDDADEESE
ncbi:MAG: hypothetical protein DBX05_06350 [Candidatus Poseidoniales archaeon]|nr:MAG: hypothetical protein DBX05_06350 [Candidatus Poseidoniales archaeon]